MALNIHGLDTEGGGTTRYPSYLNKAKQLTSKKTSTTKGEITPENFNQYYNAAYGGVPMGVDLSQLKNIWQENVIAPGMEAGRRQAGRAMAMSGAAPTNANLAGGSNEAWQQRQLAGKYGAGLAQILSQAMGQNVQNQLAARGGLAAMLGRGSTTTAETTMDNPEDKTGQFGGFIKGGSVNPMSSGSAMANKPWWLTSYGEMGEQQQTEMPPKKPTWSSWQSYPTA